MDLLYEDQNIKFVSIKNDDKYILSIIPLKTIDYADMVNISEVLITILKTYKSENKKWSILYDIRNSNIPTKKIIDFWIKIFRKLHPIMEDNQNGSSILVNSQEKSDILNKIIVLWDPIGEVKFFTEYNSSIEYLMKKNMELKLPIFTKIKLKNCRF
jgi:hypothetical protein